MNLNNIFSLGENVNKEENLGSRLIMEDLI